MSHSESHFFGFLVHFVNSLFIDANRFDDFTDLFFFIRLMVFQVPRFLLEILFNLMEVWEVDLFVEVQVDDLVVLG